MAQGACVVDVRVANWWVEQHGYVQMVKLEGVVVEARPKALAKVYARAKFRFERADGRTGTLRTLGSFRIDTEHAVSGTVVLTARSRRCDEDRPCWVNDVEVYDVDCFD